MAGEVRIEEISSAWEQHLRREFPDAHRGVEVEGVDLVVLDADTAGCVDTFLASGGRLDAWRCGILGQCVAELEKVVPCLDDPAAAYFLALQAVAMDVLRCSR